MRPLLPLRIVVALLLSLGLAALLILILYLTDLGFAVWERLATAPTGFVVAYALLIALVAGGGGWLIWRLLAPSPAPPSAPPAPTAPPAEPELTARLETAAEQGVDVAALRAELDELARRRAAGRIVVALFGEVSAGKSSLIRALLPDAAVAVDVLGGTTRTVTQHTWTSPAGDALVLADVPGTNEAGGALDTLARAEAERAHLVIYVCDGDLTRDQAAQLDALLALGKPLLLALNKTDRYSADERAQVEARLRERLAGRAELVGVQAGGSEEVLRVLPDGREEWLTRPRPAEVEALRAALQRQLDADPAALEQLRDLAVFSVLARRLERSVAAHRRERGDALVQGYARKAVFGALAAVGPGTDVLIQGYLGVAMLKDLCALYEVPAREVDLQRFVELASGHVKRNLNLLLALAGNVFKAFPGVGTVVGGMLHAVAYGLIFESLGRAVVRSLETRGELAAAPVLRLFEDDLREHLETRARRLAGLVVGRARGHDA